MLAAMQPPLAPHRVAELLAELPVKWEVLGDLALIPEGAWPMFWAFAHHLRLLCCIMLSV